MRFIQNFRVANSEVTDATKSCAAWRLPWVMGMVLDQARRAYPNAASIGIYRISWVNPLQIVDATRRSAQAAQSWPFWTRYTAVVTTRYLPDLRKLGRVRLPFPNSLITLVRPVTCLVLLRRNRRHQRNNHGGCGSRGFGGVMKLSQSNPSANSGKLEIVRDKRQGERDGDGDEDGR